jgi:hypothetical protein
VLGTKGGPTARYPARRVALPFNEAGLSRPALNRTRTAAAAAVESP